MTTLKDLGTATRGEVHERTGLARSTISAMLEELVAAGLVEELSEPPSRSEPTIGRPAGHFYRLRSDSAYAIAVDIGHERVSVGLANLGQEIVLAGSERSLDHATDFTAARSTIARLVERLVDEAGIDRRRVVTLGIGVPGPIGLDGCPRLPGVLSGWTQVNPRADVLAAVRPILPAVEDLELDNDANHGAIGELVNGALRGMRHGIYLRASRGIGAGLVVEGSVNRGVRGMAGELGHTVIGDGPFCRICGHRCLEASASSDAILSALRPAYDNLDHEGLILAAGSGDAACNGALTEAGRKVGQVLGGVCSLLNPERLVIGGQLGDSDAFVRGVESGIADTAFTPLLDGLEVVPSELRQQLVPGFGGVPYRINAELVGAISRAFESADVQTALEASGIDTREVLGARQ